VCFVFLDVSAVLIRLNPRKTRTFLSQANPESRINDINDIKSIRYFSSSSMAITETTATQEATTRLRNLLARARKVKSVHTIDPPLLYKDFSGTFGLPSDSSPLPPKPTPQQSIAHQLNYQAVENAARGIFFEQLVSLCPRSCLN
jgi:hypothetical protein